MALTSLDEASQQLTQWMVKHGLPLWADAGVDREAGCSYEAMLSHGAADVYAARRTRVQARQMFVFASAYQQGWLAEGRELCMGIQSYLDRHARHAVFPEAYAFQLDRQHQIVDDHVDTYDCAFFLLAWAYQFEAFGDEQAMTRAKALMARLDSHFKGTGGGWLEGTKEAPYRRQNPHMHLFEAFLAWFNVSGDNQWLDYAHEVFELFERYFYDAENQVIYEYFNDDLSRLGTMDGAIVEPGHLAEWIWLLNDYQIVSGKPMGDLCRHLYNSLKWKGTELDSGLLYDQVDAQGKVLQATKRLWTQTELIKAHIAMAEQGDKSGEEAAGKAIVALFNYYLASETLGFTVERLDTNNHAVAQSAPATSMYHLMMACTEAHRYCTSA